MTKTLNLIDNPSVSARSDKFTVIMVDVDKVVKDWQNSVHSYEWMNNDGQVKNLKDLTEGRDEKYLAVETAYHNNQPIERPVLGIGIMDHIEIGSRKEVLLTLYALGVKKMEVHIPISCLKDFKKFLV